MLQTRSGAPTAIVFFQWRLLRFMTHFSFSCHRQRGSGKIQSSRCRTPVADETIYYPPFATLVNESKGTGITAGGAVMDALIALRRSERQPASPPVLSLLVTLTPFWTDHCIASQ